MVGFTRDQWTRIITDCDPPTIEEVASKLADRFDLDVEYAREQIDKAIESDSPVEYDSTLGIYGGLVVPPNPVQGERDEERSDTADAESPAERLRRVRSQFKPRGSIDRRHRRF